MLTLGGIKHNLNITIHQGIYIYIYIYIYIFFAWWMFSLLAVSGFFWGCLALLWPGALCFGAVGCFFFWGT